MQLRVKLYDAGSYYIEYWNKKNQFLSDIAHRFLSYIDNG
jgi:hypothetical protein